MRWQPQPPARQSSAPTTRTRRPRSNGDGLILNTMGNTRGPVISYYRLVLVSIVIGTAIGLGIGWVLLPVQFTNADAADLRSSIKDDYIRMVSAAFQLDGNVSRASQRLAQLGFGAPSQAVNDLFTRESQLSKNANDLAALADLSRALGRQPSAIPTVTPTSATGRPAPGNQTASPTESLAAFRLVEHTPLNCVDEPDQAYLRIIVRDANGKDLPNIGIQSSSSKGEDIVYTGLKPERGLGFADLAVSPDTYTVAVVGAQGDAATHLQIGDPGSCKSDQMTIRGWRLIFQKQ